MNVPDRRPEYLSPAEKIEQAKRLIPILEAEISSGEKRQIFYDLLEMHRNYLKEETKEQLSWKDCPSYDGVPEYGGPCWTCQGIDTQCPLYWTEGI